MKIGDYIYLANAEFRSAIQNFLPRTFFAGNVIEIFHKNPEKKLPNISNIDIVVIPYAIQFYELKIY
ncbi:hypothetical protein C0J52_11825 [Blattella germanica]|nr:hypothetical protein C0J52_11825 [Blattella germanica]